MYHGVDEIFVVIDFECLEPSVWQSIGIVVYNRQQKMVLDSFTTACHRHPCMTPSMYKFWDKHSEAYEFNVKLGKNKNVYVEELNICTFINSLKTKYPNFYLLSDTPEFDVSMINDILIRHDHPVMSYRNERTYFQSICTWSSKRMLQKLGINIDYSMVHVSSELQLPHTPESDCFRILNDYMNILTTTEHYTRKD
jgi:hypothetical protein